MCTTCTSHHSSMTIVLCVDGLNSKNSMANYNLVAHFKPDILKMGPQNRDKAPMLLYCTESLKRDDFYKFFIDDRLILLLNFNLLA